MFARSPMFVATIVALAISGAAVRGQSVADPASKIQPGTKAGQETYSGGQPMAVPPELPNVPPVLPGIYSQHPPPGLPHASGAAASPGQFAPTPNPGPITGYGPGGMAPIPGAPPNPPYSYGPPR